MSFDGFVPRIRLQIYKTSRKSVKLTRSLDETAILCIVFPSESRAWEDPKAAAKPDVCITKLRIPSLLKRSSLTVRFGQAQKSGARRLVSLLV